MAPLLLYVPSAIGAGTLDMKTVAGLTMVQSLFATGSGAAVHRKFQFLSRPLIIWMGGGVTIASLVGAVFSRHMSAEVLEGIFAILALAAAALMLIPHTEARIEPAAASIDFNRLLALICALAIGLVGGMVGQSGAFIIIPVMLYVLKIPTRTVIGSSLGIVFLAALAGSIGKIATSQVDYSMALFCVIGAVAGAQLGGMLSIRTRRQRLRHVLALLIGVTALRMAWDLVGT